MWRLGLPMVSEDIELFLNSFLSEPDSSAGAEVFRLEPGVPLRSVAIKCLTALRSESKKENVNESPKEQQHFQAICRFLSPLFHSIYVLEITIRPK